MGPRPDPLDAAGDTFPRGDFPDPFKRGFSESLRRYGSLLEYLEAGFVNGFLYHCARPVGAPREAVDHPPKKVWDELARTHPEIRRRLSTSATVFERKLWREDLQRWDQEVKPVAIRPTWRYSRSTPTHSRRLDSCSTSIGAARTRIQGAYIHHLFNVPAFLPVGDFLVCAQEWTGRAPAQLLGLLQGANPDPLGADKELERLVGALRHEAAAKKCSPPRASRARWLPTSDIPRRGGGTRFRLRRPSRLPAG